MKSNDIRNIENIFPKNIQKMNRKNKNGKNIGKENSFLPREEKFKRGDAKEEEKVREKRNKRRRRKKEYR